MLIGLVLVAIKLFIFLPLDVANISYAIALALTLAITVGDLMGPNILLIDDKYLDFLVGLLFPLDCYAILILLGIPLVD
jgi:hypothetical protein